MSLRAFGKQPPVYEEIASGRRTLPSQRHNKYGEPMHHNLAFIGFGNVARALARLLLRKQEALKSKYDITVSCTGIATGRHGFAVKPDGLDINKALQLVESGQDISSLSAIPVDNSLAVI